MIMWDPEHFPGADNVPWQLLIRARYQYELDAVVASTIVRQLSALGTEGLAKKVSIAATEAVAASRKANGQDTANRSDALMSVLGDFDDWCGTRWPGWPGPRPKSFDLDPLVIVLADRAIGVLRELGSDQLQQGLGEVLHEVAAGNVH
jgi:hypothetical protein